MVHLSIKISGAPLLITLTFPSCVAMATVYIFLLESNGIVNLTTPVCFFHRLKASKSILLLIKYSNKPTSVTLPLGLSYPYSFTTTAEQFHPTASARSFPVFEVFIAVLKIPVKMPSSMYKAFTVILF